MLVLAMLNLMKTSYMHFLPANAQFCTVYILLTMPCWGVVCRQIDSSRMLCSYKTSQFPWWPRYNFSLDMLHRLNAHPVRINGALCHSLCTEDIYPSYIDSMLERVRTVHVVRQQEETVHLLVRGRVRSADRWRRLCRSCTTHICL